MKRKRLVVGQRVWLEATSMYFRSNETRVIRECEVIEANKSSAYLLHLDTLATFKDDIKRCNSLKIRVEQATHYVKGSGAGVRYALWLTQDEFNSHVIYEEQLTLAKKEAHEVVDRFTLEELKILINTHK